MRASLLSRGGLTQRLTLVYSAALGAIALFLVAGYGLVERSIAHQTSDSHVVNLAGRQRMLSQQLSKEALLAQSVVTEQAKRHTLAKMRATLALWERSQKALREGDTELQLPATNSPKIRQMFDALAPHFRAMAAGAAGLLGEPTTAGSVEMILAHERQFLDGMTAIVAQYENEALLRVRTLQRLQRIILAAALLALLAEGLFVFRPAVKKLRRSMEGIGRTQKALQQEKSYVGLLQAVATAANEAPSIDDAINLSLREVCAYTGWPVGHAYLPASDGSGDLVPTNLWHLDDPVRFETFCQITTGTRFVPGVGLPGRVLASGKPVWIADVTTDPNFPRARRARDIGVKTGFAFPILAGPETVGVLEFFSATAGEPDHHLLEMMAHTGAQLGRLFERKRAQEALQKEREMLTALFENVADGIVACDAEGVLTLFNRATREMHGLPVEAIPAEQWAEHFDLYLPDGKTLMTKEQIPLFRALHEGSVRDVEMVIGTGNSPTRSLLASGQSFCDAQGRKLGAVVAMHDITQSKRVEAERQVISEIVQGVMTTTNLEELLHLAHRSIGKFLYAENCFVALHDSSTDLLHFEFWVDQLDPLPQPQSVGQGLSGSSYVLRTGRPLLLTAERKTRMHEEGEVELIGSDSPSWLGVPLRTPSRTIGVLAVQHYEKEGAYSEHDLEFLASVGDQIALAIERKQAEEKLKLSEAQLAKAQQVAHVGSWEWDLISDEVIWSDEEYRLLGFAPGAFVASRDRYLACVHPDERASLLAWLDEVVAGNIRSSIDSHITRADGEVRLLQTWANSIVDESGNVLRLVGTSQDITERKRAEVELREAKETAEAASCAKSEFLANMSHEIRTPMNGIIGMTELVLETNLQSEQREQLWMVKSSADSLLRLLNDILDFSKIEAGKLELESIDFSLRECLGGLLKPLGLRANQKGLELVADIPADVPDYLAGDPMRLGQILINLTDNAIKFTERGEIIVKVVNQVTVNREAQLHFSVTDSGIGIPADKQSAIFEAFAQADGSTTRTYGGTGLGLAIASQLIQQMRGKIWLESKSGEGTTFHFIACFGLAKAPRSLRGAAPKPDAPDALATAGLRILLAEDNVINRAVASAILTKRGHSLVHAANGREAVKAASSEPFDLIFMDVQMPEMDGLEATGRIREMEQTKGGQRTPIVAMTAHAMAGDRERCLDAGMDDYISKPIEKEPLLALLARIAGARPLADAAAQPGHRAPAAPQTSPPDCSAQAPPIFSREKLLDQLDDDEALMHRMIALFNENTPLLLDNIRGAIACQSGHDLARAAHALLSSLGVFGAETTSLFTRKLEAMGQQNKFGGAAETFAELEHEVARIYGALEELFCAGAATA